MTDIIARLEAGKPEDQFVLLTDAICFAAKQEWITRPSAAKGIEHTRSGAYLDAAKVLVPEGWGRQTSVTENGQHAQTTLYRSHPTNHNLIVEASTDALALAAASLRAHEAIVKVTS